MDRTMRMLASTVTASAAVISFAMADAPAEDKSPPPPPAGSSAADPSPVNGPSGSPVSLDSLLEGAVIEVPDIPLPEGLICFGTEPFWSLTLEGAGLATYNTPDLPAPQVYPVVDALTATGRLEYPVSVELDAGLSTGLAVVDHEACSDGMSDNTYLWSIHLLLKDQKERKLLTGCCRVP